MYHNFVGIKIESYKIKSSCNMYVDGKHKQNLRWVSGIGDIDRGVEVDELAMIKSLMNAPQVNCTIYPSLCNLFI